MEHGYKHFSHLHTLVMHQLPEGVEVSCFGCNSSGTGTVFVCWQCNFFLHEQCYRATRSLKHPSHPSHPLTLVPFPTYPSNSFYCNSCEIIGTGFSYSCADCEFDLHVQCAYSISRATSFQKSQEYQELVPPGWNGVYNSNMAHNVPNSLPIPFISAQDPYPPPNPISNAQYHPTSYDLGYVSVPPSRENSIHAAQDPPMAHNLASVSIPMSTHNPIPSALYPSVDQTEPSFSFPNNPPNSSTSVQVPSMPQNRPSVLISSNSQNPIASTQSGQSVSVPSNYPSNAIPSTQDHSNPQNGPSVSIPTSSQNPIPKTEPSISSPTNYPSDPIPRSQDPSMPQSGPSISIHTSSQKPIAKAQYPSVAQTESKPSVSVSTNPPDTISSSQDPPIHQNGFQDKGIKHFSHPHMLSIVDLQEDEENEVTCSGCEETIVGEGYSCVKQKCDFHLHESCFHLKKEIQHKSHPEHPLILLPLAPYNNKNGEFTCNACFSDGTGFTYHCSICKYDLHIQCVNLPETMNRDDHEHELKLYYSCPVKGVENVFSCHVCHGNIEKDRWVYYCDSCGYGTHLGCVDCEECERDSILDPQAQLQRAQFQLELARQRAQLLASLGDSLSSLAG